MRNILASLVFIFVALTVDASDPLVLWLKGAPGEKGDIGVERDTTKPGDGLVEGKRVMRIGNVSVPTITVFRPLQARDSGAAVTPTELSHSHTSVPSKSIAKIS